MMMFLHTLFFVAILAIEGRALSIPKRRSDTTSPIVDLKYGSFQGRLDRDVQVFLGLPYASPP